MLLFVHIACVYAWGNLGHKLVAMIATQLLRPDTMAVVNQLLPGETLASVASWADSVSSSPKYSWSKSLHYVHVHDTAHCNFDDAIDCPGGDCVVSAITRFSREAQCNFNTTTRSTALKFLVHFIGDIAQPLHTCGRLRGGTRASVTYNGKPTSLHFIWDTDMVLDRLRQVAPTPEVYVNQLIQKIKSPTFGRSLLAKPFDITTLNPFGNSMAVTEWVKEISSANCQTVWTLFDQDPHQDFAGAYFKQQAQLIDVQLAKAGYRLATVLNQVLSDCNKKAIKRPAAKL